MRKRPERFRRRSIEARIAGLQLLVLLVVCIAIMVVSVLGRNQAVATLGVWGAVALEVVACIWAWPRLPI